jgi:uncharacterized protein (TIGR00299 family) protein
MAECTRFLRFDSVGGASGDMLLAALAAVGADLAAIQRTLRRFLPDDVRLQAAPAADRGLHGLRVTVRTRHADPRDWPDAHARAARGHAPHRTLKDISRLLASPALDPAARRLSLAVFRRLAEAEGRVHGRPAASIHFHEVGATDSIADIVGACLALRQLGVEGVRVGPLPCGTGTIECAHGAMPNPAPATVELLAGMDVVQTDEPFELVTPTAAALLATWRGELAAPPERLRILRHGFGFGRRTLHGRPNALRATLLEKAGALCGSDASDPSDLLLLETNLDDCSPQWIGDLIPRLLAAGALDAWAVPATMKKGRPGLVLAALTPATAAPAVCDLIFRATTTFGIRSHAVTREILDRRFETVRTRFGAVRVKVGSRDGRDLVRTPEFEECARLARQAGVLPRQVHEAAARRGVR